MRQEGGSGRIAELDALRGLAALAVVAFHYTTYYSQQIGHVPALSFGFPIGNYGVQLFFLISGYVIFMTLERTRNAADFVVSRFSRLFPAYWTAILATSLVVYTIGLPMQRLPVDQLLLNATMLQQILGGEHLDGSYWTLQVELFFYVQMLFWFQAGQLRRIHWVIGAWLAMTLAYTVTEQHHVHFSHTLRELLILRHIPFFALGILFYRLHAYPGEHALNLAMIGMALLVIAMAMPQLLAVALVCSAVFGLLLGGRLGMLSATPFVLLGTMSYSLYLLHQAIGLAIIHRLERAGLDSLVAIALATLLVFGLATVLTWGVERPALRAIRSAWRKRHVTPSIAVESH